MMSLTELERILLASSSLDKNISMPLYFPHDNASFHFSPLEGRKITFTEALLYRIHPY